MPKCKTEDGKPWDSRVRGSREGGFRITHEDDKGVFEGIFEDTAHKEEDIKGRCNGSEIYFLRPTDKPRFYYEGTFDHDGNITGTQTTLPRTKEAKASEEWEGTKVGAQVPPSDGA